MIETAPAAFIADPVLLKSIVDAVEQALQMCDSQARCVAIARVPARDPGNVTGLIGVHGSVSGFITVNLAERVAKSIVGGLLQDSFETITSQVIDGVGELANIVAGGIKKGVLGTPWAFANVTVPSVIVGRNYQIAYCRGLEYLSATFEQQNDDAVMLDDRLLQVAVSLIRL
jgi:chemotaxis protein CheX